jgi:hypothetical protein
MNPILEDPDNTTTAPRLFKRGLTWLRDTGAAARGRKAKRLLHRRERHADREQLRKLYPA